MRSTVIMLSNREIARQFNLFAELLLLHGKDERLADYLSGTAYRLRNAGDEENIFLRPEINSSYKEIRQNGNIEALDELIQLTPPGLFEMMRIRGLGGKKLSVLWKKAKIDTIEALLEACKKDKLLKIPGFGAKTQSNIINAIESYDSSKDRFHYADLADAAILLVQSLQKMLNTGLVELCGEVRRQSTTVAAIELVSAKPIKANVVKKLLVIQSVEKDKTLAHTLDEIPVIIYHSTKGKFHTDLFTLTGNAAHVKKVLKTITNVNSEEAIYKKAGLPFIVPEMREDIAEWDFIKQKNELLALEDITGVVHNHTDWSDGVDTLNDFVTACKNKGYQYTVISDHSKNAHYAGGLKEQKVIKQFGAIDALNKKMSPFKIFKSIECDILVSGELDYDKALLKQFDMVIISVHQLLKMTQDKATGRLIKAIENPYTTILGHMTGRQLLIRPGYPVDFKKVIDACAANKVVIEINANPYRLDMDWSHIPYAVKKGVMISVNPDAHSIGEIDNIRWGVCAARKGGLTKQMTWNAMPLKKIEAWLKK